MPSVTLRKLIAAVGEAPPPSREDLARDFLRVLEAWQRHYPDDSLASEVRREMRRRRRR